MKILVQAAIAGLPRDARSIEPAPLDDQAWSVTAEDSNGRAEALATAQIVETADDVGQEILAWLELALATARDFAKGYRPEDVRRETDAVYQLLYPGESKGQEADEASE